MKRSKSLVFVLAAGLLAAAPAALAQQQPAGPASRILHCLSILGLSDAQKGDVKQVFETEKPVLQGLLQTLKADREALEAAIGSVNPDPCAVGAEALKVHADRAAVKAEIQKIRTNVESYLTPEQKAKLEGCLEARGIAPTSQAILGDALDQP